MKTTTLLLSTCDLYIRSMFRISNYINGLTQVLPYGIQHSVAFIQFFRLLRRFVERLNGDAPSFQLVIFLSLLRIQRKLPPDLQVQFAVD